MRFNNVGCPRWSVRSPVAVVCGWINWWCDRSIAKSQARIEVVERRRRTTGKV